MKVTSHLGFDGSRVYMLHTNEQLRAVAAFLRGSGFPDKMSFGWQGQMYTFNTAREREAFAQGLVHAYKILY